MATMLRRIVLALVFVLLPGAAMAQHHDHAKKDAAKPAAEHMNFARELIAAKADLKLTEDQVKKLEAFAAKMDDHHRKMADHHADGAAKAEAKLHADLMAIFTEQQLVKVKPLMKAHMDKCEHMKDAQKKAGHDH
jgi:hypothetical protein